MQKQILIMAGWYCFIMTGTSFASPDTKSAEIISSAIVRANSPQAKLVTLNDAELGAVNHMLETHKATNALSWQTKAMGLTGFMGMVVTLAAYVHLS